MTPTVIIQVLLTAFSLLSGQDIITVLVWYQNTHLLFQKLERIVENLIWNILVNANLEQGWRAFKSLSFRCIKRELKERFLDKYITNKYRLERGKKQACIQGHTEAEIKIYTNDQGCCYARSRTSTKK